ncbi:MAG TPA: hypothetical protein VEZ14_06340 [Dehalococcoidia bacterium]|nr:hypothetical protein [Dehalococcoidia bacterium]
MPDRKPRPPRPLVPRQYNRLAHGLRAAAVVIPGADSDDDWRRFEAHIMRSLAPEGAIEVALAVRAAESLWRLDRVTRAERNSIAEQRQRADEPSSLTEKDKRDLGSYLPAVLKEEACRRERHRATVIPPGPGLEQLMRYEAHLNRQFYQALHELEARQARRRGEPAPLARLDVQSLGDP